MKIYIASSWRNAYQPDVVLALRAAGHEVYDFRNPGEGEQGFGWHQIDPNWKSWSIADFQRALDHRLARHAFRRDQTALEWCEACVLVLPSGMSSHLEAGWCAGRGKKVVVYAAELKEAELMYGLFDEAGIAPLFDTLDATLDALASADTSDALRRAR